MTENKTNPDTPVIVSDVIPFNFHGHEIRALVDNKGNPWFVATDVCNAIGIANPSMSIHSLDSDEKFTLKTIEGKKITTRGAPEYNIISFPGMFRLTLRSYKPEAKPFQRWVSHEVLPQIYKTGKYVPEGHPDKESFSSVADEFNTVCSFLIHKGHTTMTAMQLANSAVKKLYSADYLGSFTLPATVLKAVTDHYTGRLLTPQDIGNEVDAHWRTVRSLLLEHKYIRYTIKGEMFPTPKAEEYVVYFNQLATHQKEEIKHIETFWWKESAVGLVESLIEQQREEAEKKTPAGAEWWEYDHLLTPTEIGKAMGLNVERVNTLLLKTGYQVKSMPRGRYELTKKGAKYAQRTEGGIWYWKNTILPALSETVHTKHPGNWGELELLELYRKTPKFHEAKQPETNLDKRSRRR